MAISRSGSTCVARIICAAIGLGGNASAATVTVLHTFDEILEGTKPGMGAEPTSGVIADSQGNLYGTTSYNGLGYYNGVVFRLKPDGTETVLHRFTEYGDIDGLIRDSAGNLMGTGRGGRAPPRSPLSNGFAYKLSAGAYTRETPYGRMDRGNTPVDALVAGPNGMLYGVTAYGGAGAPDLEGFGTVYQLSPKTGRVTTVYAFSGGVDGYTPFDRVVIDAQGNLYGTTYGGGTADRGVVFKVTPSGQKTTLHSFAGSPDGSHPVTPLVIDAQGNLFGTTGSGGTDQNLGAVFKVTASGVESVLHAFIGGTDGIGPSSGLTADSAGNLYGTTMYGGLGNGTLYKIAPDGQYSLVYTFTNSGDFYNDNVEGSNPQGTLLIDSGGAIIGTATNGGALRGGTVYKITP